MFQLSGFDYKPFKGSGESTIFSDLWYFQIVAPAPEPGVAPRIKVGSFKGSCKASFKGLL